MVNANVIISVSAVLVALILTIVVVMREDGDPETNYSVSVSGKLSQGGKTMDAGMYFCTGDDCMFYDVNRDELAGFPGYFALVGFTDPSDGTSYLTEHSISKTFVYDSSGQLTDCRYASPLSTDALEAQVAGVKSGWDGDKTYSFTDVDGSAGSFAMESYSLSNDPANDSPTVVGHGIPTADECLAAIKTANGGSYNGVGRKLAERRLDSDKEYNWPSGSALSSLQESGQGQALNADVAAVIADFPYFPGALGLPSGWTFVHDCEISNTHAKYLYKESTMVLTFAGSNDMWDWIQNFGNHGHATFHKGFYEHVTQARGCLDAVAQKLKNANIEIDYVIGHSLGGASSAVYRTIASTYFTANTKVVTFGAPKTRRPATGSCKLAGTRIFNEVDPVAGNALGIMGDLVHDVKDARQAYFQGSYCKSWSWGICQGWTSDIWNTRGVGCTTESGGCSWLADCLYNIGTHAMATYRLHGLKGFNV
jgi:hypothetical protein